jgi:flagellar basal-body rod protein FlgG
MIKGFYTARTGVSEHQKLMDIIANNMANVNTEGYKTINASFQELLYQRARMPDDYESNRMQYDMWVRQNQGLPGIPRGYEEEDYEDIPSPVNYFSENKLRLGSGGRLNETPLVMTLGSFNYTGRQLDCLISGGTSFFAIEYHRGDEDYDEFRPIEERNITFTRHGAFQIWPEGVDADGTPIAYLITMTGEYVLDADLNRIRLPDEKHDIKLVSHMYGNEADDDAGENLVRVGLFTFDNVYGLHLLGNNDYVPTSFSGEAILETRENINIITHSIEMSNVHIAKEMVKVIHAQRAYQANLAIVRTADEIEAYINQLRQ